MSMTTFKLSNTLFTSARLITVNFPTTIVEIEALANVNPTSGVWRVTSSISDWCSDYPQQDYDRDYEITREHADDGRK